MDFGLYCDNCQISFDNQDRTPLIMPCGQTICYSCVLEV